MEQILRPEGVLEHPLHPSGYATALDEVHINPAVCPCTKTDTCVVPPLLAMTTSVTLEADTIMRISSTARTHYGMELDVEVPVPAVSSTTLRSFVSSCLNQLLTISS